MEENKPKENRQRKHKLSRKSFLKILGLSLTSHFMFLNLGKHKAWAALSGKTNNENNLVSSGCWLWIFDINKVNKPATTCPGLLVDIDNCGHKYGPIDICNPDNKDPDVCSANDPKGDECLLNLNDIDNCGFPGGQGDLCNSNTGSFDPDHCGADGTTGTTDICDPDNGDPDQCNPNATPPEPDDCVLTGGTDSVDICIPNTTESTVQCGSVTPGGSMVVDVEEK